MNTISPASGFISGFTQPLLYAGLLIWVSCADAQRNDSMFPSLPAAKEAVDFDGRGFLINGKRTFLSSGSIHYPRVPRELWHDRLLRLQRGSFNAVETYAFWNFHEPRENEFDFAGDKDIGAFFGAAQELGLYGIARVGPYVCAEWDFGGYPVWIKFKPDVAVRTENPGFLALNDHWYDKIIPIIAEHQIHHGGNIVLVQLENEHPNGWGRVDAPYFQHLTDKAVELGIEVPHFMSGLNHGGAPQPKDPDTSKRDTPWFSTEFWSGWFNLYGRLNNKKLNEVENAQWMIMARGGAGQNFYMLHGGTNFDTWNDPSGAGSYDYGAAIGQAGDLRPVYYRMKRANQLAQSFPDILADGSDVSGEYRDFVTGGRVTGARRSPAGTIVFLTNHTKGDAAVEFQNGSKLTARANETFPIVINADLSKGLKIADSTVRVLAVARHDDTVTVVVHGRPGESGRLVLASDEDLRTVRAAQGISVKGGDPRRLELEIKFPESIADECLLEGKSRAVRIVAVNSDLGCMTWVVGKPSKQYVICGPGFVQDLQESGGKCSVVIERAYGVPSCGQVAVYGAKGSTYHLGVKADTTLDGQPAPILSNWQMSSLQESGSEFDDSSWKKSESPLQMGADGDISAFAWYRAGVDVPAAGPGTLYFKVRENPAVFINGRFVPLDAKNSNPKEERKSAPVTLRAGKNQLAIFTSHAGRNKAFGLMGPVTNLDNKGITGSVTLDFGGQKQEIKGWKMKGGVRPNEAGRQWAALGDSGGASALFKATFVAKPPGEIGAHPVYRADFSALKRGTMWINGHCLGRYPERIPVRSLYLPECWIKDGANELVVFDEEGAANVKLIVENAAGREVIRVSEPVDPATPIVVPVENPPKDLASLNKDNLAFQRPATDSGFKKGSPATLATDGDIDTSWMAASGDPGAWLCVDLEKPQQIQTCEIVWDQAAKFFEYTLESSLDGQAWTKIGDQTTAVPSSPDSPSELSRINFPATPARYLRVTVTGGVSNSRWASIAEIRLMEK